jgi:hypothetical protein
MKHQSKAWQLNSTTSVKRSLKSLPLPEPPRPLPLAPNQAPAPPRQQLKAPRRQAEIPDAANATLVDIRQMIAAPRIPPPFVVVSHRTPRCEPEVVNLQFLLPVNISRRLRSAVTPFHMLHRHSTPPRITILQTLQSSAAASRNPTGIVVALARHR